MRLGRRPTSIRFVVEWLLVGGLVGALLATLVAASTASADVEQDPLSFWAVDEGLVLKVDAAGFALPTAIAVVPSPGDAPDDPVYYVAELRGAVKAVTNDRSVVEIAQVPTVEPPVDDLSGSGQSGLGALCLDDAAGDVYATYTYPDEEGVLRNDIIRLDTGTSLGTEVVAEQRYAEILAPFQSAAAHQIGSCGIDGDRVFVGVGDGGDANVARDRDVLLGKVLCLTSDGEPCTDNPYADEDGPARFVHAVGLRNPFALEVVDGEVYVADNGLNIDRLVHVEAGDDLLWNGSDKSIAARADLVFEPAVSPVQLAYLAAEHPLLGAEAATGAFAVSVFNSEPHTGVMTVAYDLERRQAAGVPSFLLQWVAESEQHVLPVAVGPEGLYTAGAFPGPDGTSEVLYLSATNDAAHPVTVEHDWGFVSDERTSTLTAYGCVSCHSVNGGGGGIGPSLDAFGLEWRLRERIDTEAYDQQLRALNAAAGPDEAERVAARERVLAASGTERAGVWVEEFVLDPQFVDPEVAMPDPGLTREQAREVRDALLAPDPGPVERFIAVVRNNTRVVAFGFALGAMAAVAGVALLGGIVSLRRRRRRGQAVAVD